MRRLLLTLLLLGLLVACQAPEETTPVPVSPKTTPSSFSSPSPQQAPTLSQPIQLPSIADIVKAVEPAVVSITTESFEPGFLLQPIPRRGAGTGIVFSADGYILTNNHVVEGANKITVTFTKSYRFPKGASFPAKIIGGDLRSDVAVIKIEADDLPVAKFGSSSELRVGDWVIAIGNAYALEGGPTVSIGIVSALGRLISVGNIMLHDLIQTDAAINPGNSGGPLVNLRGEVVGINTAIIGGAENIGFAIAIDTVLAIKDELIRYRGVRWGWLGLVITNLPQSAEGVLIQKVVRGSPAEYAGLREGDVIIRFGGVDTPDLLSFQKALCKFRAGDKVEIIFIRNNKTMSTQATLAKMPE